MSVEVERRTFLLTTNGGLVRIGSFEIEGPIDTLPDALRGLVLAAGTDATFTFEFDGDRWTGVSIQELVE